MYTFVGVKIAYEIEKYFLEVDRVSEKISRTSCNAFSTKDFVSTTFGFYIQKMGKDFSMLVSIVVK